MKKSIYLALIGITAFVIGYSINEKAISDTGYKVAVVDVQTLISKSSQVNTLKANQQKKLNEMQSTINKARQEISKETDTAKINQLEEKYREQINNQKIALDNEYNTKLKQIDQEIKTIIVTKAKNMKYDIVLPKNMVLYGGDDITNEVAKSVK